MTLLKNDHSSALLTTGSLFPNIKLTRHSRALVNFTKRDLYNISVSKVILCCTYRTFHIAKYQQYVSPYTVELSEESLCAVSFIRGHRRRPVEYNHYF